MNFLTETFARFIPNTMTDHRTLLTWARPATIGQKNNPISSEAAQLKFRFNSRKTNPKKVEK